MEGATAGRQLLTPEVEALIGQTTEVTEMYGTVDQETVRRYVVGIPDQDPRHWDEELARPRFGGPTTPAALVTYIAMRRPPWQEDDLHETMLRDSHSDGASIARKVDELPSLRSVAHTRSHLHAGDEIELYRYPNHGDRIFFQSSYSDIQEKVGKDGIPFLLVIKETRYWNQDQETLCVCRTSGIER